MRRRTASVHCAATFRYGGAIVIRPVVVLALVVGVVLPAPARAAFQFADVVTAARKLAQDPYKEPEQVPEWLRQLTYDQWRDIRYRPDHALWRDGKSRFQVQFFHPGLYYDRAVKMNLVDAKGARPIAFSPSHFEYGANTFASKVPQDLGYAGFRVHYPIKTPTYYDEVIVFLGASYFRAVGKEEAFGLSARALAIDTALPSGEEFPYFTEFWLVKPAPNATEMHIYALLDSPSVAGAYHFVVKPGEQTAVDVESQLFLRREIHKLGIAPLTSMFFHGENTARQFPDFRPEVHDSDGLMLAFGNGEWLWRPLDNPHSLQVSAFQMEHPRGFGLVQRDRDFASYQDLETRQDNRPSAWIVPHGDWVAGGVELVEIPTTSDTNDNIATYWIAKTPPQPATAAAFAYTVYWYGDDATRPPQGKVVSTRRDNGTIENGQRFVIDFAGGKLPSIPADQVLRGAVTVVGGNDAAELVDQHVVKNPFADGWRLTFQLRPKRRDPIELRAYLDKGGDALTETWSEVIQP